MNSVLETAQAMTVATPADAEFASAFLKGIRDHKKRVDETFDSAITSAREALDNVRALKEKALAPVKQAEAHVKGLVLSYNQALERAARVEAERRAAEERARIEAEALERAAQAEAEGDNDIAEAIVETVPEVPVMVAPVKAAPGIAIKTTYGAEVYDLHALIQAVAADKGMINLVKANDVALNSLARSYGADMRIPGVRAVAKQTVAGTR